MDLWKFVYDRSYDLACVVVVRETVMAVDWSVVSLFLAAQWLPYESVWEKFLFLPMLEKSALLAMGLSTESLYPSLPPFYAVVPLHAGSWLGRKLLLFSPSAIFSVYQVPFL